MACTLLANARSRRAQPEPPLPVPPKYSLVERERRWLVARLPTLPVAHRLIEDRYIIGTRLRLRRITDSESGAVQHKLTRKYESDDATARPIVTAYLDAGEHEVLTALPAHCISKRRYRLAPFSVDLFDGPLAGLILAESEQPDAKALESLPLPDWLGADVTENPCYQGGHLAAHGLPET
jgi:CYTH domain-containing protein